MVISVDYGTTFTGVAYLACPGKQNDEHDVDQMADEIRVIQSWSKCTSNKVPSKISYSPSPRGCRQWGYDMDDESRVIKWTKLELEETNNREAELQNLSKLLWEMRATTLSDDLFFGGGLPVHLTKEPEDILRDYLCLIAEKAHDEISSQVGRMVLGNIPIDLVVSHPAVSPHPVCFLGPNIDSMRQKWSDKAMNSIFHAIRASFNEDMFPRIRHISFVSEPEACAHYTLRAAWQKDHVRFRKVINTCRWLSPSIC